MRYSRGIGRPHRSAQRYRPELDVLEARTAPALFRGFPIPPAPPPATQFQVIVPQDVESGQSFNVVVRALDANDHVVSGFRGTVQINLGMGDAGARLPATFTFSAADHGRHVIHARLAATGVQTMTMTSGTIAGQANFAVDAPVTHFAIVTVGATLAGSPTLVDVVALDASNQVVPGYAGTVHFSSTNLAFGLPNRFRFTPADAGIHEFTVTFANFGMATLRANDVARHAISGSAAVQVFGGSGSINLFVSDPTLGATLPNTGGVAITDPIGNISYGANIFGTGTVNAPNDAISNISYGLNPFGAAISTNMFGSGMTGPLF